MTMMAHLFLDYKYDDCFSVQMTMMTAKKMMTMTKLFFDDNVDFLTKNSMIMTYFFLDDDDDDDSEEDDDDDDDDDDEDTDGDGLVDDVDPDDDNDGILDDGKLGLGQKG